MKNTIYDLLEKGRIENKEDYELFRTTAQDLIVIDDDFETDDCIRIYFENGFAAIYADSNSKQDIQFYNDTLGMVYTFQEANEYVEVGF